MSDSHTTGRYTIIAALITGILSIIATVLPTYLSKSDPPAPLTSGITSIPASSIDAPPITPPLTPTNLPPVEHSPVSHDPESSLAIKRDTINLNSETEITKTEAPKKAKHPEPKEPIKEAVQPNNEETIIKITPPTKRAVNLFNRKFTGNLAIVDLKDEDGISLLLNDLLSEEQHTVTTSFFQSEFNKKFKSTFWENSTELVDQFGLPNSLKCICIIKEGVSYQQKERFNEPFSVAKGTVTLKLLNTDNSAVSTVKITAGGSGADDARAYESFQENFITEFKNKNYLQKFESCKN